MVGTEGEDGGFYRGRRKETGDGVKDAGGIVHHTVRINYRREFLLLETLADVVGKTRPDEEHLLAGTNLEIWLRNINYRPEIHQLLLI